MTKRQTRLKRILIFAAAIVILAIPLTFILEDFVGDAIVTPTAYLIWLGSVLIDALPESYLLGFAIAVVIYTAIRSLLRDNERPRQRKATFTQPSGAAASWLHRLQLVTKGTYSEQRLDHYVGQLLLKVIAYEHRCSLREASQLAENNQVDLPPDLADYLQAALSRRLPRSPNLLERLKTLILGSRRSKTANRDIVRELDPVLIYLEKELKIRPTEEDNE